MPVCLRDRRLLLPLLVALTGVLAGCEHDSPPATSFVPVSSGGLAPMIALVEVPIGQGRQLEALLDALDRIGAAENVTESLVGAAKQLGPSELAANPAARLWVLHAIYRLVMSKDFRERFQEVRDLTGQLHAVAPDAAETRFARAYLRWVLLADGTGGLQAKGVERGIVLDLERDLALLVAEHPAFVGPGGFDHARLDTELKSVRALLAVMPEHDVPTPTDPTATAAPEAATAVTVP